MKITRPLTLDIPETVGSVVELQNGLHVRLYEDGKWHRYPHLHMTHEQMAEKVIRVVSTVQEWQAS